MEVSPRKLSKCQILVIAQFIGESSRDHNLVAHARSYLVHAGVIGDLLSLGEDGLRFEHP